VALLFVLALLTGAQKPSQKNIAIQGTDNETVII
jgi:hypothetical protein